MSRRLHGNPRLDFTRILRILFIAVACSSFVGIPLAAATSAQAATPADVGQFSAPFTWPNVAVHVMLEPNGNVLSIDAWDDAPNKEYLWNPTTGTFTLAAYARNLFCSGHTQLGNGKTLIVGGNASANNGIADTTLFDPTTNTWTRGPDMSVPRWYPTATELADGRVFVYSGDSINASGPLVPHAFKSSAVNSLPSVYDPGSNSWQDLPGARLTTPLYPFLFTLTDGRIVDVGPDTVTRTMTPGQWTWKTVATSPFDGDSAVMYRPDKIMKSGSYVDPDFMGADTFATDNKTAVIDMSQPNPTWRTTAPMALGRGYHVLTSLPDGKVLVTGGESQSDGRDLTKAVLPTEMWDPNTETWTTMASLTNGRLYHSTALLLPDGRVLVAGGGQAAGGTFTNQLNAEIYSPPYLFKGTRPTISSAPPTFDYSGTFTIQTPNASNIASVALIKNGAMTHAINMSQRYVPLTFTAGSGSLSVHAPVNAQLAPPGYYMLWIVDNNGVPSVSTMIKTSGVTVPDTTPPTAPTGLSATGGAGFASLTWTGATDNVGVDHYNVYRSTTSGFTPSTANRIAQSTTTSFTDTGVSPGTYFYKVTAEDLAGNVSGASNEAPAAVTADTIPPTVSLTAPSAGATVTGSVTVSATAADANGVAGVQFKLDGTSIGAEDTATPYSMSWDTTTVANGSHTLTAVARDSAGNTTTSTAVVVTVSNAGGTTGLVAAYGFDEGSGTTTADQSGSGNVGTISGATWSSSGKFGKALSFNGTNSFVSVAGSSTLNLTNAMTIEAWVNPNSLTSSGWNTVVLKERPGYYQYALYGNTGTNRPSANAFVGSTDADTRGTAQIPSNAWTHLAATYDGTTLALYVNGTQVSQTAVGGSIVTSTGALKIGGNAIWGEFFSGLIDEVRIYNRTLSSAQIQGDMTRAITNPDTAPPSAPTGLTATGSSSSAQLNWIASTDDVGVTRYDLYRSTTSGFTPSAANRIAQPSGTSYTDSSLAAGTYYYKVQAEDGAGNLSASSNEASAIVGDTSPPTAPGALSATGAVGKATLGWGAATDNVGVVKYDLYRSSVSGFTPALGNRIAQPTGTSYTDTTAPGSYYYKVAAEDGAGNIGPASNEASATVLADTTAPTAPSNLTASVAGGTVNLSWSASSDDVAVTKYDLYRGTSAGFTPTVGNRIAQPLGTSYSDSGLAIGSYYYKVAAEDAAGNLSGSSNEVTASVADSSPPTAPSGVATAVVGTSVNISWSASSDNVGVARYNLYRGTSPGFTPSVANRIAQPLTTLYSDLGLTAGSYYYKLSAEDAAGNVSGLSNEAQAVIPDTSPPTTPSLSANGGAGQASLSWTAATDNVAVTRYDLYRSTSSGFTPSVANRIAQPSGLSYSDLGLAAGTYYYRLQAEDGAGNLSAASNEASALVTSAAPSGLVAAYGFDEGSGTTTADRSGNGNTGTVSNTTWAGASTGKFGNALSFNGTNAWVSVNSSSSLNLTTGMTAEAWVNPTALGTSYRTVVLREQPGNEVYALYANQSGPPQAPLGEVFVGGYKDANASTGLATGAWAHLAETYDGSSVRLYVNGTLVSTTAAPGSLASSSSPLRIGGNSIWGEYFSGLIDEVRIYNRALSASEIQTDMTTPITPTDTQAPSAPANLSASGAVSSASLSWTASTDNVGVTRYDLYRSTTSGFTPSAANRIAQPSGTSYTDSSLAAGTYYYKVQAEDGAGNLSASSNEASAIVGDTSPPTAPGALSATGAVGKATLGWGAATDNVGVVKYDLYRSSVSGFTPALGNRIAQPTGTSYTDTTAPGSYYYKVAAEDGAGNIGPASNEASATVLADTTAPTAPSNLTASVAGGTVNLSWSASSDDVAVTRYDLYRGTSAGFTPTVGNRIAQPLGTSYSDSGLAIGSYYYKVAAEDAAGNLSGSSNEVTASVADSSPPTAPSGVATAVVGTSVNISWSASSDNVGVARYNLYRGTSPGFTPSLANRIAQPLTTLYSDLGLTAGSYYYKLSAEDAAGNVSGLSNEAQALIPDTSPPTTPSLSANGGAGQASLSWTAATDNVAVTRYDLYRSTSSGFTPSVANRIAQPSGLSYSDLGLAAGTYYYRLQAEDGAGNLSAASNEASALVTSAAPSGLVAAYGFDEGSGTTTADRSGNGNTGTLANTTWAGAGSGRFGNALFFNGSNSWVTVNSSSSLNLTTGMTLEAWVKPSLLGLYRTVVFREQPGNEVYALYASQSSSGQVPAGEVFVGGYKDANGPSALPTGTWAHLAETYDGSSLRLYVNGTLVATTSAPGSLASSSGVLRIGGNNIWGEWFNGWIDEVRVYNRALSAGEIQNDMFTSVTPDTTPPTVVAKSPADGSAGINVGTPITATFNEFLRTSSMTSSNFFLKSSSGTTVPATISYDTSTNVATLTPQAALQYGTTYTATIKGGSGGVTDYAGNPLSSDVNWSFTTEVSPPPLLVVTSSANPFARYTSEILRAEGLDAFTTLDASLLAPAVLGNFDVVLLGDIALSAGQVTTLSNWVNGGGKLIALHPDKQLASLLGLSAVGTTLSNAYLQVNTSSGPGVGITGQTLQYHGSADRYTLNGASSLATLYSNASTATSNPALSLRSVGSSGGQAAAFTYDLARSIVYTRQGNPAWAGQERDGVNGIRPDDLFFGAKSGDVQPDWLDTSKIAIPQADEQQRLLVNLITQMERSKLPLPHFWYLPRGLKAAVAMSGDDHGAGGTSFHFDQFKQDSTPGCVVALWQCVRSTSYIYPSTPLSNAQAAGYLADGFEIGLHPLVLSCPPDAISESELGAYFDSQLLQWQAKYTSLPSPVSDRIHCVFWPGWITSAKVELAHGMRMDANYYHYPDTWIGAKPGFLNGGGFPMRFADTDGSMLDVYQSNTNMDDEANQSYPATVNALLDNALGPNGYYGVFGTNMHTDYATDNPMEDAIVSSAQARGVPVISYKQLLDWTDGRNASTIRGLSWNAGSFNFTTTVGSGAVGLQTMLPTQGPTGTLSALTCGGAPVSYNVTTIKGIQYAMFDTITGSCQAIYS